MKISVEDVSSVKKVLHIEVPVEAVDKELDGAYRELKRNAKVKGFRPGKAPRSLLERLYQKEVNADVASRLIQSSFGEAVRENELDLVGQPRIDPPDLKASAPYVFQADIEVNPQIDDIEFQDLPLEKTLYEVSDAEVDLQLKMLQRNMASYRPISETRPVVESDYVLIDYEGFKEGRPFDEAQKTENFTLKVGSGRIHDDFDRQLVGMQAGEEKTITVVFDADHANQAFAGQGIDFKVTLREIRQEILPELDDDFARQLGSYGSIDELRQRIVDNLQEGYQKRTEQELNEQIFSALLERVSFEVPDSMVEIELEGIVQDTQQRLTMQNMTMEETGLTPEGLKEKYRDTAVKQVQRHLLLRKLIEQEKMELSDEEVDAGLVEMAQNYNQPVEAIRDFYREKPQNLEFLKNTLLEKKAIRLIIEAGNVTEIDPPKDKDDETAQNE
jgi:trigger factor